MICLPRLHPRLGFTLIEIVTVLAVIGVLAGLLLTNFGYVLGNAKSDRARAELAKLAAALEDYHRVYGDYPQVEKDDTLQGLRAGRGLYLALTGWRGVKADAPMFTTQAKSFIRGYEYVLLQLPTPGAEEDNCILDPWGNAYRYDYRPGPGWKKPGYVLFSAGPDEILSQPLPDDGLTDGAYAAVRVRGHLVNADNIYAGKN